MRIFLFEETIIMRYLKVNLLILSSIKPPAGVDCIYCYMYMNAYMIRNDENNRQSLRK